MVDFRHFHFWCQKVLPLVYDDSLSYYEVLCKVVKYLNSMIDDLKEVTEEQSELKTELAQIQHWIDTFDTEQLEKLIAEKISAMIFVEITNAGYIVYHVPDTWHDIQFNTTGLDIEVPDTEYGRLTLSY